MIEKSKLIKLITQNTVVYVLKKGEVYAMPLDLGLYEKIELDEKFLYIKDCSFTDIFPFENLFETRKQAEWASKYQRIPHTEYLDLPTWEEIQQNIRSFPKELKTQAVKNIVRFSSPRGYFSLIVYRCYGTRNKYLDLSQCQETLKAWKATEENYIKACDLCVKLFKGEK